MPNPSFQPVIGQNFGDVMGQQYQWAGFNNRVDEGNIARAAQAQEVQNNWLARVQQAQEQDAQRQSEADRSAQRLAAETAYQGRADTESARRFDIGTQLTKDENAVKAKQFTFNHDEKNKSERETLDAAKNFATEKSDALDTADKNAKKAFADYQSAMAVSDTQRTKLEADNAGKIIFDKGVKQFVGRPNADAAIKSENDQAAISANEKMASSHADAKSALDLYTTHKSNYDQIVAQGSQFRLTPTERGGKTVFYSPWHNAAFGAPKDSETEPTPAPAAEDAPAFPRPDWASGATFPWTPPVTETGTNPPATITPPPARGIYRGSDGPTYDPPPAQAKQFKDKSGTTWIYTGGAANPATDKDPSHWVAQ
jgi:hypothetical protein